MKGTHAVRLRHADAGHPAVRRGQHANGNDLRGMRGEAVARRAEVATSRSPIRANFKRHRGTVRRIGTGQRTGNRPGARYPDRPRSNCDLSCRSAHRHRQRGFTWRAGQGTVDQLARYLRSSSGVPVQSTSRTQAPAMRATTLRSSQRILCAEIFWLIPIRRLGQERRVQQGATGMVATIQLFGGSPDVFARWFSSSAAVPRPLHPRAPS